ncbi:vWA domain-containing protein [Rhodococcus sp. MALMAid1271]|uniref:vWA domain-containing protein n=1 Tax=Rhodococcus sp. MALMAid1271 TaxID=3411744 RepID=UPI003BA1C083
MSRRASHVRALVVVALVGISACLPIAAAQPPPAAPAEATTAVDNFGACIAGQKQGNLLLMIDESGSLKSSDPNNARVTAANYLLDRLTRFADTAQVGVDVAVAGFSTDFTPSLAWTSASQGTLGGLRAAVDAFAGRRSGLDTDYWTALDNARAFLAERGSGPEGAPRCQAIAWFSDGKLDFDPRPGLERPFAPGLVMDSDDAVREGVDVALASICRDGGIADQVRSSGISIFGIGLANGTATPSDFDSMRAIVTGEPSPQGACGAITSPRPGDFYLAQNLDDLLFAFDALSTPGQAPITTDAGVCQGTVCEDAKHRFVLDDSIASVDVLASSDVAGLEPNLVGPAGQVVPLPIGAPPTTVDGAAVTFNWESDRTVRIEMAKGQGGQWSGVWAVAFVDPTAASSSARSKTNIHISGGLFPVWSNMQDTTLRSGEKVTDILLGMVDGTGVAVDPQRILGNAVLSAELVGATGDTLAASPSLSKEDIGRTVELDLTGVDPGQGTLRLTLAVTTAGATDPNGVEQPGTELTPRVVDIPVELAAPVGYPTVAGLIDFGGVEGSGTAVGALTVNGPGCVWIDGAESASFVTSPDGVGSMALSSPNGNSMDNCVSVAEGATGELSVELETQNDAKGAVNGSIKVMAAPTEELSLAVPQDVRFTAQLTKPLNEPVFIGALIATMIVGIGLPFLFLYVAKWFTSRIPNLPLTAEQIPITVDSGSVMRDGIPFALRDQDLVTPVQGLHKPARTLTVGSVTLKTHVGRSPFGAGYVAAEKSPSISASSDTPAYLGKPPRARMSLAVHNKWLLTHDPAGPADAANVILLAGGLTTMEQRNEIVEDLTRRLPALLTELRAAAEGSGIQVSTGSTHSSAPFGGGGPDTAQQDRFGGGSDPFGASMDPYTSPSTPPPPSDTRTSSSSDAPRSAPPAPMSDPFGAPDTRADPFGPTSGGSNPW